MDDAAYVKYGGDWRMPTKAEFEELYSNCDWKENKINFVKGHEIKSRENNETIFLPFSGQFKDTRLINKDSVGFYWTSELFTSFNDHPNSDNAVRMEINISGRELSMDERYIGNSIRPVISK